MPRTKLTKIDWPYGGYSSHMGYETQDQATSVDAQNVQGFDPRTGRLRGGQRWGQSRLINAQVAAAQLQDINHIVTSNTGAESLSTVSTRNLTLYAVANGDVVYTPIPATSYTTATNGSAALSSNAFYIGSTPYLGCDIYYSDGVNYKYVDAGTNTVNNWTASAGTLPANGSDKPRHIMEWNDRIVLSGIKSDPTNWFMSAVGDPTDFNYSPSTTKSTQAVAGNNSAVSQCPDIINSLVPMTDQFFWMLCDHSIYQVTGDPMYGGRISLVTDKVGGAFGKPWCRDPVSATVYFFGQQGGLWSISQGGEPIRVSAHRIEEDLADVDVKGSLIRLVWEPRHQHVLIFITPLDGSATTHYCYDTRNDAFWPIVFADTDLNPTAVHTLDGDNAGDRTVVFGGQDGRIRKLDYDAKNDDDSAIDSYVWLGPIQMPNNEAFILDEIQATLSDDTDAATLDVFADTYAEAAAGGSTLLTRTLAAGRNGAIREGGRGASAYVRISNSTLSEAWGFEAMRVGMRVGGREAQRAY